jgi:uncharacterized membrane protein YtjA (UPF0391 family)
MGNMLRLALLFLVLALAVGALAVIGPEGDETGIKKIGFLLLLVLFIVSAAASAWRGQLPPD